MSQPQSENQSQCPEASEDDAESINSLSSASDDDDCSSCDDNLPPSHPQKKVYNTLQTSSATNHPKAKAPMVRTVAMARALGQWGPGGGGGRPPRRPMGTLPPGVQASLAKARRRRQARLRANPPPWMSHPAIPYNPNSRHRGWHDLTLAERQARLRQRQQGTGSGSSTSSSSMFERSLRR